jgi:hypothetical protein
MSATPAVSGGGEPTGAESVSSVQTLWRGYRNAAGQVTHEDAYFNLSGVSYSTAANLGTENTHYYRTRFGYDPNGALERTQSPTGTITRTVHDALVRPIAVWVGTHDTPTWGSWAPGNNTSLSRGRRGLSDFHRLQHPDRRCDREHPQSSAQRPHTRRDRSLVRSFTLSLGSLAS